MPAKRSMNRLEGLHALLGLVSFTLEDHRCANEFVHHLRLALLDQFLAPTELLKFPLLPLDLVLLNRKVYILEYSRQTDNKGEFGSLPGRILELSFSE